MKVMSARPYDLLYCWGLTTGMTPEGKFQSVSAGIEHTCGVRADGTALCWGNTKDGRSDAPDGKFLAVSAGGGHSCGLREDHSVTCWGANDKGQSEPPPP
jgi:alpha-tubulin suppressor-like RCC1 family protein